MDLFDWCAVYINDDSSEVIVTALQTMLQCNSGEAKVIRPLDESEDKRIRAAAVVALAKHSGADRP